MTKADSSTQGDPKDEAERGSVPEREKDQAGSAKPKGQPDNGRYETETAAARSKTD